MLEDYAYLAEALIALYDTTGETVWLARAQQLADAMQSRFSDKTGGGYFLAESDPDTPMTRPRRATPPTACCLPPMAWRYTCWQRWRGVV